MTAHELARLLLEGPDNLVVMNLEESGLKELKSVRTTVVLHRGPESLYGIFTEKTQEQTGVIRYEEIPTIILDW